MFTACPHCQFLVARDPHAGAAPTDCPRCGKALSMTGDAAAPSLATLLHAAPASAETDAAPRQQAIDDADTAPEAAAHAPAPAPPIAIPDVEIAIDARDEAPMHADTPAASDLPPTDAPVGPTTRAPRAAAPSARKVAPPRFAHRARTTPVRARRVRLQWVAVATLSLLLCVQVVVADRGRLAMQAGWRPVVSALCGVFRCDLPTWREPAAFTMLSRDVRPLLDTPGTLQAQATFRNEARWAQAWPVILLTLKDADGRTLGARALHPRDYLPEDEAASAIGPGQSAQMAVRIREPSASVVAFSFDFR